jgi:hypothetical protein
MPSESKVWFKRKKKKPGCQQRVSSFVLAFLVKASQNEVEDWHSGLPDCRVKGF